MLPERWRDHPGSSQQGSGGWGDDGDERGQEVSLLLPVEALRRNGCWPLVEKSGLSRPGPAGRGELSAESVPGLRDQSEGGWGMADWSWRGPA